MTSNFEISASVVKQLGEELITDEVTALIELVKNSYDADASYASITVDTNNYPANPQLYFSESNGFSVEPGYISVQDDGHGMDEEDIQSGWLTISLSPKRRLKAVGGVTPGKQRTPLGDKGLGRLSTQRLGQRLEMFTYKETSNDVKTDKQRIGHHVAVDWADFSEASVLSKVPVYVEPYTSDKHALGTELITTKLRSRETWTGDKQQRLVRGLAQLLFPFGDVRPFNVHLRINGERIRLDTLTESIRDAALARFKYSFDGMKLELQGKIRLSKLRGNSQEDRQLYDRLLSEDAGADFFAYLISERSRFKVSNIEYLGKDGWFISYQRSIETRSLALSLINGASANPGPFHGEIDEFTLRTEEGETSSDVFSQLSEYRAYVQGQAGIRVFRDGFGIRPFGFDGNDWLGIGKGQTSGRSFYGLRPHNVIGYVALTARENSALKETTSREGFVDDPYSQNFYLLMESVIKSISDDLYSNLRRSYGEYKKSKSQESDLFPSSNEPFVEMRAISTKTTELENQFEIIEPQVEAMGEKVSRIVTQVNEQPLFAPEESLLLSPELNELHSTLNQVQDLLKVLKEVLVKVRSLGAIADNLEARIEVLETQLWEFSELAGLGLTAEALTHEINTVTQRLAEKTNDLSRSLRANGLTSPVITTYLEYVHSAISALRKQLSHLAPSLQYVREKKEKIDLAHFFEEQQEFYAGRFSRSNIEFVLDATSCSFLIEMNRGKLTQIIDNLILNAEYWLKQAVAQQAITDPKITIKLASPYVFFEDNGLGVDQSVEITLFQPFVTTKPRGQGRGLGLFIVNELLDSSGGAISLLSKRNQFGRRYIFQIDLTGVTSGN